MGVHALRRNLDPAGRKAHGQQAVGADFGASVALSADGDTALIGAPREGTVEYPNVGAAWVFTRSAGAWSQPRRS